MILHIPHSSRRIPDAFRDQFILSDEELSAEKLKMTDAYTDELFDIEGAEKIVFPHSRLLIDVERFPDDDAEPMSKVGMGKFYNLTAGGKPLRRTLTDGERRKLGCLYDEHHARLTAAVSNELQQKGRAFIVDCHSFPGHPLSCDQNQNVPRPDFCIGTDFFHTSEKLHAMASQLLADAGHTVRVNDPYAGTLVPLAFYEKEPQVKSVMIEINRRLYMDETTGVKNSDFSDIRNVMAELLTQLHRLD